MWRTTSISTYLIIGPIRRRRRRRLLRLAVAAQVDLESNT